MEVTDGRTKYVKELSRTNRARVKKWFKDNPGKTITACKAALKLHHQTVKRHIVAIQEEENE